jgi:hypothetical protein
VKEQNPEVAELITETENGIIRKSRRDLNNSGMKFLFFLLKLISKK